MTRNPANGRPRSPRPPREDDYGERHFEARRHHVRSRDNLAENMAEAAVTTLTTGAYQDLEDTDSLLEEELGGPFVETSAEEEIGFDDSAYPPDASVEPFPRTLGGLGDEDEELEAG